MTSFFLAWEFLTILPAGRSRAEASPQALGRSMAFYPLIGLVLGLLLWAAHWAFFSAFPRALADGLILILLVLLTGAFHLDGLADTLDGMAYGKSAPDRLAIMKDHRVGTFGVVGLILVLGIKFLALDSLPEEVAGRFFCGALILGRWSMVQLIYRSPYARPEGGLGKAFKDNLGRKEMIIATSTSLLFSILLLRLWGALLWLIVGVFTLGVQVFFQRRIGGVTGDVLGAANEINEALALVIMAGIFQTFF